MINKLKYLREQSKKSQKLVASELSVPYSTYRGWEEYGVEPNIDTLKALADYFNVSLDYLVGREFGNDIGYVTKEQHKTISAFLSLESNNQIKAAGYIDSLADNEKK